MSQLLLQLPPLLQPAPAQAIFSRPALHGTLLLASLQACGMAVSAAAASAAACSILGQLLGAHLALHGSHPLLLPKPVAAREEQSITFQWWSPKFPKSKEVTELSGLLFIGDAILQINGINVRKCRHEEVVQVLRNAGEEVTLTVSFLKRAPGFLKLPLNEDCACIPSDQSSGTSSPLCDSGLHLNYHPNNTP
uniref:Uncharacterized protein n=1 Tax=Sphaerodactylus townsendi TaxID=933632 RepID=A0ACB8FEW0_9SAUR